MKTCTRKDLFKKFQFNNPKITLSQKNQMKINSLESVQKAIENLKLIKHPMVVKKNFFDFVKDVIFNRGV
jgi:hypothetical protein